MSFGFSAAEPRADNGSSRMKLTLLDWHDKYDFKAWTCAVETQPDTGHELGSLDFESLGLARESGKLYETGLFCTVRPLVGKVMMRNSQSKIRGIGGIYPVTPSKSSFGFLSCIWEKLKRGYIVFLKSLSVLLADKIVFVRLGIT